MAGPLQLCRPLSGAVRLAHGEMMTVYDLLQLCRPLSGAVSRDCPPETPGYCPRFNCAAPERGRLAYHTHEGDTYKPASIVPPPFGGG